MSSQKNSTTGRALSMASMGAGIAGSYAGYLLQRAFLGEAKSRIKLKSTHTRAARKISEVGGSLRDVQQLAGHASLGTTARYIEGDQDAQRKVVALI